MDIATHCPNGKLYVAIGSQANKSGNGSSFSVRRSAMWFLQSLLTLRFSISLRLATAIWQNSSSRSMPQKRRPRQQ